MPDAFGNASLGTVRDPLKDVFSHLDHEKVDDQALKGFLSLYHHLCQLTLRRSLGTFPARQPGLLHDLLHKEVVGLLPTAFRRMSMIPSSRRLLHNAPGNALLGGNVNEQLRARGGTKQNFTTVLHDARGGRGRW